MVTVRINAEQLKTLGLIVWYVGWMPLVTWAVAVWGLRLGALVSWPGVEVTYMFLYSLVLTYTLLRWQAGRSAESEPEREVALPAPQKETATVAQALHQADQQLAVLGARRR